MAQPLSKFLKPVMLKTAEGFLVWTPINRTFLQTVKYT